MNNLYYKVNRIVPLMVLVLLCLSCDNFERLSFQTPDQSLKGQKHQTDTPTTDSTSLKLELDQSCRIDLTAGSGKEGFVSLCQGEDWWLPVQNYSDEGDVVVGYGYPVGYENNEYSSEVWPILHWKSLEQVEGKIDAFLDNLLNRYAKVKKTSLEKRIGLDFSGADMEAPAWIGSTLSLPKLNEMAQRGIKNDTVDFTKASPQMLDYWIEKWTERPYSYPFWNENYLQKRKNFLIRLKQFLDNHEHGDLVTKFGLYGEFAMPQSLTRAGVISLSTMDQTYETFFTMAIEDAGFEPKKLLATIGPGGRAFKRAVDLAEYYGTGLGNHGMHEFRVYRFVHHLKSYVKYDENLNYYKVIGEKPYAYMHTDAEYFEGRPDVQLKNPHQYDVHVALALHALSLDVDSLLFSAYGVPSQGEYIEQQNLTRRVFNIRERAFDEMWDVFYKKGINAYYDWIRKTIGKSASTSAEAYCNLTQSGRELQGSHAQKVGELTAQPDWGHPRLWPYWVSRPLLKFSGFHCEMDTTIAQGKNTPTLHMTKDRVGVTFPDNEKGVWGSDSGDVRFYLAQTTDSPLDYGSEEQFLNEGNHSLYFRLNSDFKTTASTNQKYAVKIIFENNQAKEGQFTLDYASADGWKSLTPVYIDSNQLNRSTVTYHLTDATFDGKGPGQTDLAIRTVSGAPMAFLRIRVIKL